MVDPTHAGWARQFGERARAYWSEERTLELTRGKRLAVLPGEAPLLLRALGLLHRDATMPPRQVRKFFQINHAVRLLERAVDELRGRHAVVRLLDAGCGRSYLTLLLAWCARERWAHRVEVLGVDRNAAVIAECERRAELAELDEVVRFVASPLEALDLEAVWRARFGGAEGAGIHGVVALHACDTATCDAIALGVARGAELVAVAPCCHAELARGWAALEGSGPFAPVWGAPHLRRELAAHVTDAMRMLLLRGAGYEVTALELVAPEHTAKNTMLRAQRRGGDRSGGDPAALAEYEALVAATGGAGLALAGRLARRS